MLNGLVLSVEVLYGLVCFLNGLVLSFKWVSIDWLSVEWVSVEWFSVECTMVSCRVLNELVLKC